MAGRLSPKGLSNLRMRGPILLLGVRPFRYPTFHPPTNLVDRTKIRDQTPPEPTSQSLPNVGKADG
jgi:hypothetical protein